MIILVFYYKIISSINTCITEDGWVINPTLLIYLDYIKILRIIIILSSNKDNGKNRKK